MHWRDVWFSKQAGFRLIRIALTPLSWLYAAGWQGYLTIYRFGWKKAKAPHHPVVCIGNLKAGGTGKSPVTRYVADVLSSLQRQVVISCSGYGAPRSEAATLTPKGPLDAREWGDEAAMLRAFLPDTPLIVGRDRVEAAKICNKTHPDAVLLLDDGFQHLPLAKDLTILLDPPAENGHCLPAGPYREPRRNRSRADLVLPGT